MSPKPTKKPRGMAAKLTKAVAELRRQWEQETNPIEKRRLGELLALTDTSAVEGVFDDRGKAALQAETPHRVRRPKLF